VLHLTEMLEVKNHSSNRMIEMRSRNTLHYLKNMKLKHNLEGLE